MQATLHTLDSFSQTAMPNKMVRSLYSDRHCSEVIWTSCAVFKWSFEYVYCRWQRCQIQRTTCSVRERIDLSYTTMMHNVFALVESLSRILQASNRTVTGALEAVQITLREYSKWEPTSILQIWLKAQSKVSQYSLHAIKLPRHVGAPSRYEQGKAQALNHQRSSIAFNISISLTPL